MIGVIADDFTGAAELAGLGLRYDLTVEMDTVVNEDTQADLLIIATDTRSMKEQDAEEEMEKVTRELSKLNPDLIYKKVDSVLRGHILAELAAQVKVLNLRRALLVPANPSLGRTISNGTYFYNDQPIHLSSFSNDPEFAITSSDVLDMLRVNNFQAHVKREEETLPDSGIIVGEVTTLEDLKSWTRHIDKNTFPAGASGFFTAILDTMNIKKTSIQKSKGKEYGQPVLFVCGSTFNKSRQDIKHIKSTGGFVSYMPESVIVSDNPDEKLYEIWKAEILSFIKSKGKAIISIDEDTTKRTFASANMLREKTAKVVGEVFKQMNIQELFIEGGSTAAAVIKKLQFNSFFPVQEIAPGVIRMRVKEREDLCVTLKPGSYSWPADVAGLMNNG